jgi:hypothetical protein
MTRLSLLTQVAMIGIACTIVLMYIKPKITIIRETQDLTSSYELETKNVSQVNQDLKAKMAAIEALKPQDLLALERYLPDHIDDIAVMKDIAAIIETAAINEYGVVYGGVGAAASEQAEAVVTSSIQPIEHTFAVTFSANYSQLKSILTTLETNNYLLQVTDLNVTDADEGALTVTMKLSAFARLAKITEVTQ